MQEEHPLIDREAFFDHVRKSPFGGKLTVFQVDGMTRILDEWDRRALTDWRWCSYMLATVFHETARTMQPIKEYGSDAYLRSKPYYPFIGEGLVQVTWKANYAKFGAVHPGDLLQWPLALRALFDGMIEGEFTGLKLSDFFNGRKLALWVSARKIINGEDDAALIAGYAKSFLAAIVSAQGAKA
jgi:putative chitinase